MSQLNLDQIPSTPIGQLSKLPVAELHRLLVEAKHHLQQAKHIKEWLEGAVLLKYEDQAAHRRQQVGKTTGSVQLHDAGYRITAQLPKKVAWQQNALQQAAATLQAQGENIEEYIDVSYKVAESKFNAWPMHIRQIFEAARTVTPGKPSFNIEPLEETNHG